MSASQSLAFAASKDSSQTTAVQNPCIGNAIGAKAQSKSYESTTASGRYQASNLHSALRQFGLAPFTNSDGDRIDNSKDSLTESL